MPTVGCLCAVTLTADWRGTVVHVTREEIRERRDGPDVSGEYSHIDLPVLTNLQLMFKKYVRHLTGQTLMINDTPITHTDETTGENMRRICEKDLLCSFLYL